MTKFLDPSFSSRPATDSFRDGWDQTFGRKTMTSEATPMPSTEDLAAELASIPGLRLSPQEWSDFLASPPDAQQRFLDTLNTAAVKAGPDYLKAVLTVLTAASGVAGSLTSLGGVVQMVQALVKC
jgi:hypothetical protein